MTQRVIRLIALQFGIASIALLSGCAGFTSESINVDDDATLTPRASTYRDLLDLPEPRGRIIASVYSFRDQTGQYRPPPASTFATAVTQGATSMLVGAMNDSGWFVPLEREGLQNLLTERRIVRASLEQPNAANNEVLPNLLAANILLEGGIIAYETNIKTGGAGARYFGIGSNERYQVDQVTINLRAVDIRSGRILDSVLVTKSIASRALSGGAYGFIEFNRLLELEAGVTRNEPAQLCVLSAIEAALIHLIARGVQSNVWALADGEDSNDPVLQRYLDMSAEVFD